LSTHIHNMNVLNIEAKSVFKHLKNSKNVLKQYGIFDYSIELIGNGMNSTYKVIDKNDSQTYFMRITPADWLDQEEIKCETNLLMFLSEFSDVKTCTPVRNINNSLVGKMVIDSNNELPVVLFKWIEEATFRLSLVDIDFFELGRCIALLHNTLQQAASEIEIHRPIWDYEGTIGKNGVYDFDLILGRLSVANEKKVAKLLQFVDENLKTIPKTEGNFGIVHGDLYTNNLFCTSESYGFIDFDMFGYGYFMDDLLIYSDNHSLSDVRKHEKLLHEGYQTIRPLPFQHIDMTEIFIAFQYLRNLAWILSRKDPNKYENARNIILIETINYINSKL
jgi:Ser/Thr protein kinase RdoA (MazF antagonist)